jgi:hypothetical protein
MGTAPWPVAVAVRVEHRLQPGFQQHRRRRLRHPAGRIRHAGQTHPCSMVFRYLHAPHRPREVTPGTHPVPQLVEVIPSLLLELPDADRVHARRTPAGPDLLPRLIDEALADLKRLHLRPGPDPRLLPWRAGPGLALVCTAPSLQPHYRAFTTTTSRPAPVPRPGTLPLAVSAARGPPSRGHGAFPWPPVSGRQVLLFPASACGELTPPLHRHRQGSTQAAPRLRTCTRERTPLSREFCAPPVLMPSFRLSMPQQWFTRVRLLAAHLTR